MERILVTTDEFDGRYVAMKSVEDNTIIGVGDDPERALHIYPVVDKILCSNRV